VCCSGESHGFAQEDFTEVGVAATDKPLSVVEVLQSYRHLLVPLEASEILAYKHIWYVSSMKQKTFPRVEYTNKGYDNAQHDYTIVNGDHIAFQYEMCMLLGRGSFGHVYKCFDHKRKQYVAVKIVKNKPFFNRQAKCEVRHIQLIKQAAC
jgi:dual specificity tyrosine-phosphorylation-regulated kinase 2/3/4